jgi:hypothetical protein
LMQHRYCEPTKDSMAFYHALWNYWEFLPESACYCSNQAEIVVLAE